MHNILYLHGFHSSPSSAKITIFQQYITEHCSNIKLVAPQLPCKPKQVMNLLEQLIEQENFSAVIGSSLGGYLATFIHNKLGIPAVVINPAVKPFELLHDYLGEQTHPITGEHYQLTEQDMIDLKALYQAKIKMPDKVWLLQQEKDEVLDYRQALERYQGCKITFELGGDHSFVGFDRFPAQILEFFDLTSK